jgi:hypothetical protein
LTHEDLGPYKVSEDELERLRRAHRWVTENLVGSGDVVGVGIGLKTQGGKTLSRLAVRVLVRRKLAPNDVDAKSLVPPDIEGIPTDVEEVGEPHAGAEDVTEQYRRPHRPMPAGVSIGPSPTEQITKPETGTLGCYVQCKGVRYLLSNNHVLAQCNELPKDALILQPGNEDKGRAPDHVVARLSAFWEMGFGAKGGRNKVDAAVAELDAEVKIDPRVLRNGGLEKLGGNIVTPYMELRVQKSGRTTGHTTGTIKAVKVDIWMSYENIRSFPPTNAELTEQFRVLGDNERPFSTDGDSGSLVTTIEGNHPVGLLVGSDKAAARTTCTPIATVLEYTGKLLDGPVTILTE